MKGKDFRRPKLNQGAKITVTPEQLNSEKRVDYPVYSFKYIKSPHDLSCCSEAEKAALISQLVNLSKFTWAEIRLMNRKGMGAEKIPIKSLKVAKPNFITEEVQHLMAFRFSGNKPFIGHLDGNLFHIIYIDNKFTVYDHGS